MRKFIFTLILFAATSGVGAFAQEAAKTAPPKQTKKDWALTPEQRQTMAKSHEQMAACLRTNKPLAECHDEMRKSCEAMGKDGCPMMGAMDHSSMHHKGMERDTSS